MRALKTILPHGAVILSLVFAVFLVLDLFNPMMNFVDNPISRALMTLWCLCAAGTGVMYWKEASQ